MSKAYVLLSGGIDSTAALYTAHTAFHGSVTGVILQYGQRHYKEVRHAVDICRRMNIECTVRDVEGIIGIGGLTNTRLEIPSVSYDDLPEGVSPTYVPFRNGLFLSIATSLAAADPEAVAVYYGAHAEDAARDAYPDCSMPFISSMKQAIQIGTYGKISLHTPWADITKAQVIGAGEILNVPWALTWSCYEGRKLHCGICPTCRSRRDAFVIAKVKDPTEYAA